MSKALLLGTNDQSALAIIRSLGEHGVETDIAAFSKASLANYSRYCHKTHYLGEASENVDNIHLKLLTLLEASSYDVLFPVNDIACQICQKVREQLEGLVAVALPDADALNQALNKAFTMSLAQKLDVPIPAGLYVTSIDQLETICLRNSFPKYVKPIFSAKIVNNKMAKFHPVCVNNVQQLKDHCRFTLPSIPVLIQEACHGEGYGVYLLANRGRIVAQVAQKRIHEPDGGGGSSYRQTIPMPNVLREYSSRIIRELKWTGVAMIEFKGNPLEGWKLIEINGRYWGSLSLTIRAGLELPFWHFLQAKQKSSAQLRNPAAKENIYQRNLRRDLWWLFKSIRSNAHGSKVLIRWILELRRFVSQKEGLDVESLSDPLPMLVEWWKFSSFLFVRSLEKMKRSVLGVIPPLKKNCRQPKIDTNTNVLFVCRGNICRSAFAEQYARQVKNMKNVRSAGTLAQFNRMVPSSVEELAAELGVEMSNHRSENLNSQLLEWADVVFAMDMKNLGEIKKVGKHGSTYLLGGYIGITEIDDPYMKPISFTCKSLFQVKKCIDLLSLVPG